MSTRPVFEGPGASAGVGPPSVRFRGRDHSCDALAGMAVGWAGLLAGSRESGPPFTAVVLANHPEAVAAFFAVSCLPEAVVVLGPDPKTWRTSPAVPAGARLVLPPALHVLATAAESAGLRALCLPPGGPSAAGDPGFLRCPSLIAFTSGSTGPPKPVCIATESLLRQSRVIAQAYALPAGCGVVASLPLSTHYGLGHAVLLPAVLGARLGLVEPFDHRAVLDLFASREYHYWAGTPLMADVLARAPLSARTWPCPPVVHSSAGALSVAVFHRFRERFGVPVRPSYGRTENGFITADLGPPGAVRPDAVGRAAPGIEIRIGDDPFAPLPVGEIGRVWFRSPWYMQGYGFPPALRREGRHGWWPTEDIGSLDADGYLKLAGRIDDCFKTASGHLVTPAAILGVLEARAGAGEAVVVPLEVGGETVVGVAVEGDAVTVDPGQLRALLGEALPPWMQPRVLLVRARLPRLVGGKVDRRACIAMLEDECNGPRP